MAVREHEPIIPGHPAKFSDELLPLFVDILQRYGVSSVLDPLAGTGKIGKIKDLGFKGRIAVNELELEWAVQAPKHVELYLGDARHMPGFEDGEFQAIVTSPVYGNRMSDHHNARDKSRRYTYRHMLGRPLTMGNAGRLQWGEKYRELHTAIWQETIRVLAEGGIFILNVKDHVRRGERMLVSQWHRDELVRQGLELLEHHFVKTPGNRHGANGKLRIDGEDVWVLRKPR